MAKKDSTPKRRGAGRPRKPPEDLRTTRFSFRIHPDLYAELTRAARIAGLPISTFAERCLIARINRLANAIVLDNIGRYATKGVPSKGGAALHELMLFEGPRPNEDFDRGGEK